MSYTRTYPDRKKDFNYRRSYADDCLSYSNITYNSTYSGNPYMDNVYYSELTITNKGEDEMKKGGRVYEPEILDDDFEMNSQEAKKEEKESPPIGLTIFICFTMLVLAASNIPGAIILNLILGVYIAHGYFNLLDFNKFNFLSLSKSGQQARAIFNLEESPYYEKYKELVSTVKEYKIKLQKLGKFEDFEDVFESLNSTIHTLFELEDKRKLLMLGSKRKPKYAGKRVEEENQEDIQEKIEHYKSRAQQEQNQVKKDLYLRVVRQYEVNKELNNSKKGELEITDLQIELLTNSINMTLNSLTPNKTVHVDDALEDLIKCIEDLKQVDNIKKSLGSGITNKAQYQINKKLLPKYV